MSTNSKLRALAAKLPPVPKFDDKGKVVTRPVKIEAKGSDILKANPDATVTTDGGIEIPVNPLQTYIADDIRVVPVNHFDALRYFFDKYGEEGVNKYIDQCYAFNKVPKPLDMVFSNKPKIISLV